MKCRSFELLVKIKQDYYRFERESITLNYRKSTGIYKTRARRATITLEFVTLLTKVDEDYESCCDVWMWELKDGGHLPEVDMGKRITKLVDQIASKFQRLHQCFRGPATK